MRYYKISEQDLLSLLKSEAILDYFELNGVNNWEYYGSNITEYLASELNIDEEQVEAEGYDFEDIAIQESQHYEII